MTQRGQVTTPDDTTRAPKHANPTHTRQDFRRLTLDWAQLHLTLPTPPRKETVRRSTSRVYGHPAEWASDTTAEIADLMHSWHGMVAEHRNETPPRGGAEQRRVVDAWNYLEPRIEQLCQLVTRDDLTEIGDLHRRIRHILGYDKVCWTLPVPCPSCELITLQRTAGMRDFIACGNPECSYIVHDDPEGQNYKWLIRVCLSNLIDNIADTPGGENRPTAESFM